HASCAMIDFFVQADDRIRDGHVTGVQTCALPIWFGASTELDHPRGGDTYYEGMVEFRGGSEPHFNMAVPDGKNAGVAVADVNLRFILEPVSIKIGTEGHAYAYVVDSAGQLIGHPDISAVLRHPNLSSL